VGHTPGPFRGGLRLRLAQAEIGVRFRHDRVTRTSQDRLGREEIAKIRGATGLGSSNCAKLADVGRRAFFDWISTDDEIATARAMWNWVVD
jgi:hypothetical protein